jgi:protein ImuA
MIQAKTNRIAALQGKVDRITKTGVPRDQTEPPRIILPIRHENTRFMPARLPAGCIHELNGAGWDAETGIAASGFAAAMLTKTSAGAILWALRHDTPYAPRLAAFGLDPDRLIFCRCRNDGETLAALEEALRTPGIAAAIGEVEHVTLTQNRRLHLICERADNLGMLMRRQFHGKSGVRRKSQGSAAATRWRIQFAPTETQEPGLGPPRWRLDLLYCRGAMPASFLVEWNDEARHLRLVAKLADHEAGLEQSGLRRAGQAARHHHGARQQKAGHGDQRHCA